MIRLRHVFYVQPPESMVTIEPLPYAIFQGEEQIDQPPNFFMDLKIEKDEVEITTWGCVVDNEVIQPTWIYPYILEREVDRAMVEHFNKKVTHLHRNIERLNQTSHD